MRAIDFHGGNYAIDVKRPRIPDDIPNEVWEENWEYLNSQIEYLLKEKEEEMQRRYPSYDISIEWTGRSGGWFEIKGNWELEQIGHRNYELQENPQRKRIIETYILPSFQKHVDNLMTMYYDFWQSEKEQYESKKKP